MESIREYMVAQIRRSKIEAPEEEVSLMTCFRPAQRMPFTREMIRAPRQPMAAAS